MSAEMQVETPSKSIIDTQPKIQTPGLINPGNTSPEPRDVWSQLNESAKTIFRRLHQQVLEESQQQQQVPTLLLMLVSLSKMSGPERARCVELLGQSAITNPRSTVVTPPRCTSPPEPPQTPVKGKVPRLVAGDEGICALSPPRGAKQPTTPTGATPPGLFPANSPPGGRATNCSSPPPGLFTPPKTPNKSSNVAIVLANLANFSTESRDAIIRAGGMTTLLELVREGDVEARHEALVAVLNLLQGCTESQASFLDSEGLQTLLQIAPRASYDARLQVARILSYLVKHNTEATAETVRLGGTGVLVSLLSDGQVCAPHAIYALRQLVLHSAECKGQIVAAGGIALLGRLLQVPSDETRGYAAGLLGLLIDGNLKNQAAAIAAGVVLPLLQASAAGSLDTSRRSIVCLSLLALNSSEVCALIASAGGAPILTRLAREGHSREAAATLRRLPTPPMPTQPPLGLLRGAMPPPQSHSAEIPSEATI